MSAVSLHRALLISHVRPAPCAYQEPLIARTAPAYPTLGLKFHFLSLPDLRNASTATGGAGYAVAGPFALALRASLHIAARQVTLAMTGAAVVRRPLALKASRVFVTGQVAKRAHRACLRTFEFLHLATALATKTRRGRAGVQDVVSIHGSVLSYFEFVARLLNREKVRVHRAKYAPLFLQRRSSSSHPKLPQLFAVGCLGSCFF